MSNKKSKKQDDYCYSVEQIISSFIKGKISGSLGETMIRALFVDNWDHQADCDRYSFACIELIKLLSNREIDNLIKNNEAAAKEIAIEMLCRLIPFFEDLQQVDLKARLDLAYLQVTKDADIAALYEDEYTIKLGLQRIEKQMHSKKLRGRNSFSGS